MQNLARPVSASPLRPTLRQINNLCTTRRCKGEATTADAQIILRRLDGDRGTANQVLDQGYGVVCDEAGNVLPDLIVIQANQEHGVVAVRPGSNGTLPDLALGTRLRILPNHACATGAQHQQYHVLPENTDQPMVTWDRFGGW